jgi:crotonobetainyl-CoA:carnitine CoA-transferase CaiB-like acyl-CoA transferase
VSATDDGDSSPATGDGLGATLAGIKVLDLTRNLAGPYCTMILGDLGADVVKVEQPERGDDTRHWAPPTWNGESTTFLAANRNKRSVAIDLDHVEGAAVVRSLARCADVVVESFRPGSLERRGLGYDDLRAGHDDLIWCSITAFGHAGPRRDDPGYDPVLQAATGIMSVTGDPAGSPTRLGVGAIDLGAAMWGTIGIMAALAGRNAHGKGTRIDTSLYEASTWWLSYHLVGYLATGVAPRRHGTATTFIAPYEVFPTGEGDIFVAAPNDNLFAALVEAVGVPELASDVRFTSNQARVANRQALRALLTEHLAARPAEEWERVLRAHSVPSSTVRTVADLARDQQLAELGLLGGIAHPAVPDLQLVGLPLSREGARGVMRRPPPLLGEHTSEVLSELGYGDEQVEGLRRSGAVG